MRLNLMDEKDGPRAYRRFNSDGGKQRLTFVGRNGARDAIAYFEIRKISWRPDMAAVVLKLSDCHVTIHGRNLIGLCQMLEEHEIGLLQEHHAREAELTSNDVFIERIDWDDFN